MTSGSGMEALDRRAIVERHNPRVTDPFPLSPLTVGNGEFAFTADITGLQSFPEAYLGEGDPSHPGVIPLGTQAQWAWHWFPNPEGYTLQDALRDVDTYGQPVSYPYAKSPLHGDQAPAVQWLRQNPHRLHLGRIGLEMRHADGRPVALGDVASPFQELDLWTGMLKSRFVVDGQEVQVWTCCHPDLDAIAVRISSALLAEDRIAISLHFPYGSGEHLGEGADWDHPERHETRMMQEDPRRIDWVRTLDADGYYVAFQSVESVRCVQTGDHRYSVRPSEEGERLQFVVAFAPSPLPSLPPVRETEDASAVAWERFWLSGGAMDLSESADPRAGELERRIVLSQYLTAIQCAGSLPPQETGLTFNSWYGKYHLEMHWWHAAHFALWGRVHLLEKSISWYETILPMARETARRQGYRGARWPKMVGPAGRESPSNVGPFLIWQQPHPIYFAELVYRARPTKDTLARYQRLVSETAEFMASFAVWREDERRYVLGPPLIPAQERFPPEETFNPPYELEYWVWGLATAQRWRERLGMPRDGRWDHVMKHLALPPMRQECYVNVESHPDTFAPGGQRTDHPSLLGAYGLVPGPRIDQDSMRRTLHRVMEAWRWDATWGWDFPMIAMTAARVGEPEIAIQALLMPVERNTYLANGHNYNRQGLTIYLPGNGGMLMATAMMAAGWDGCPEGNAPGFPADGWWTVHWDGLQPMP